jgi:hypothetical protein
LPVARDVFNLSSIAAIIGSEHADIEQGKTRAGFFQPSGRVKRFSTMATLPVQRAPTLVRTAKPSNGPPG